MDDSQLDLIRQASRDVVAPSLAERGCLFFDVLFDESNPRLIRFYEAYQSREAFEAHLAYAHTKAWAEICMPHIERSSVRLPESTSDWRTPEQHIVVVFGATGQIGHEMIKLLSTDPRCLEVRALTRNPDGATGQLLKSMGKNVRVLPFGLEDLEPFCEGATDAFVVAPLSDDMGHWHARVAAALKAVDIQHVVKVSVTGARAPESVPPPGCFPSLHAHKRDE